MSAGSFIRTRYQTDNGLVMRIRVQPETLALTLGGAQNAAPTGDLDLPFFANVGSSRRRRGVNCRRVRVRFTGSAPAGYSDDGVISLPWLDRDTFPSIPLGGSAVTGSYLGASVELVGTSGEAVRLG